MSDVKIGDRRVGYLMQPLNTKGRPINHGNNYANANSLDDARAFANQVIGKPYGHIGPFVEGVSIEGRLFEFTGGAWRVVLGPEAREHYHYEVIRHPEPAPLVPWLDEGKRCYFTTVLDRPETVHERRSNGTCQCGHYGRWEW